MVEDTFRGGEGVRPLLGCGPANGEREVGPTALGGSGRGGGLGGDAEGPGHPGTPAPQGVDLCQRPAEHPTRSRLTSRRCSPDRNALGWLPGPGRARRRVIKGPGKMGGASAPGRSQSGGGRRPAWRLLERPIRRRGVGGAKAGTAQVAGSILQRQGAAEGCAAGGGKRTGKGRSARFPSVPRGGSQLIACP